MKRAAIALLLLALSSSALARGALVDSGANDGPGSLRAALESGANNIRISRSVDTIFISEPLEYQSEANLRLRGSGQVIDATAIEGDGDILSITQGADVRISDLTLIGNAAQVNEDPTVPVGGKGIDVSVPLERTGVVKVELDNVTVTRVGHHGVHVSDCSLGDDCGGGSGGGGEGSPASVMVKLNKVLINKVGFGRADADGVRVDDRGDGDIYFTALNSTFINVGADGVELDEGNNGDVIADVRGSLFDSNGEYCNLVPTFEGTPCDDDGDRDVDDGFDIDEAGPGILYARVSKTEVTNNFDEGLDFDAEDEGGAQVLVSRVVASGNQDEGLKVSEEGSGSVAVKLKAFTSIDNNGGKEGVEIEEENEGDLAVEVVDSNFIGGEDEELKLEQKDDGQGGVRVRNSVVVLDLDGVNEL